jgi:hypothetical protein
MSAHDRRVLRVRRYVDDRCVNEYLLRRSVQHAALEDANWAIGVAAAGARARVVIDDPHGDVEFAVVLECADGLEVNGRIVYAVSHDGVEEALP